MTRQAALSLFRASKPNLLVAAGMLVPLLVLYRRLLFENQVWLDFDFLLSYGPRYEFLQAALRSGELPLWIDGYLGGFPVPFSEFGWFYPVTWLFLTLLPMPLAYHAQTAFGLLLAALAGYWLARTWGLSRIAGFLGGYVYAFCPFVFATSRFLNYADIFFVLPAGLAATEHIARGRLIFVPALSLIVTVAILAGHPQIALMLVSAVAAYGVFRAVQLQRAAGSGISLKFASLLTLAFVVALASGAPRLLPVLAVTADSTRAGGLDFATAAGGAASPLSLLLGYLYPSFDVSRVFDDPVRAEPLAYSGLLAIPLATLAVWTQRKRPAVLFLVGLAIITWVLALGGQTPIFEMLHRLPLWGFFRQPGRFIILTAFAIAFLSAFGLRALLKESTCGLSVTKVISRLAIAYAALVFAGLVTATVVLNTGEGWIRNLANRPIDRFIVGGIDRFDSSEQHRKTLELSWEMLKEPFTLTHWNPLFTLAAAILSAVILLAYVQRRISPRAAAAAAALVLVADIFVSIGHEIHTMPARYAEAAPEISNSPVLPAGSRVFSYRGLSDKWELSVGTQHLRQPLRDQVEYLFLRQVLTPNLAMRSGLTSIDGYENLMSARQAEILSYIGSERTTRRGFASHPHTQEEDKARTLGRRLPALAALGVDAVLSGTSLDESLGEPADRLDVEFPDWTGVDQRVWIYAVPHSIGQAYLTGHWQRDYPVLPTSSVLGALASAPPGTVFVDGDPGFRSRESDSDGHLLSAHSSNGSHVYEVEVDRVSLLVANSFITRGWKAEVDERLVPYMTANRFGAAVVLTPGKHTVRFSYSPPNWTIARGFGLAGGASLALMAGAAAIVTVRSRWTANRNGPAAEN